MAFRGGNKSAEQFYINKLFILLRHIIINYCQCFKFKTALLKQLELHL